MRFRIICICMMCPTQELLWPYQRGLEVIGFVIDGDELQSLLTGLSYL